MTATEFVYWRQQGDGNNWVLIDVLPTSLVARWLADHPGEIYDDGYGNRYRRDEMPS